MMRKGTGAAFVIMPDDREGKMVLEYVRWWTFSYLSQGINKLLTFKEQQLSDQERVGSRSPPPPMTTYGPISEQGQPPRSSQHRKGHQPGQKQTRTMKGKGGSAPVSQHASPIRGGKKKSHNFFSSTGYTGIASITSTICSTQGTRARAGCLEKTVGQKVCPLSPLCSVVCS